MTHNNTTAEYKATLMAENARYLLGMLLPTLTDEQQKALYDGKNDRPITAEGVASNLECILLPHLQHPVLLVKSQGKEVRGLVFEHLHEKMFEGIRVHELSSGVAQEYFDLYHNPDCLLFMEEKS
ncbi:MAG: hypothetical protein AABY00_02755 [Nanoarchaeota archaeon]